MAAAIAFLLVVGGVVVWQLRQDSETQIAKAQTQATAATQQVSRDDAAGGPVARRDRQQVRQFDGVAERRMAACTTRKPAGRSITRPGRSINGKELAAGVLQVRRRAFIPWLTTEDEKHTNFEVRGSIRGTGFVVNSQGFILTNRHLGASWKEKRDAGELSGQPDAGDPVHQERPQAVRRRGGHRPEEAQPEEMGPGG